MRILLTSMILLAFNPLAFAFGKPEHSSVAIDAKDSTSSKEFSFKVEPTSGMAINLEGPWKLEIKSHDGLDLTKTTYSKGDMNESLPGFVVASKPTKTSGQIEYSLTSFICTKDKTQCFREVHNGKQAWSAAK